MKKLLYTLSIGAFLSASSFVLADEDTAQKFRINGGTWDFHDPAAWTEYEDGDWQPVTDPASKPLPWERTQASSMQMKVKMDNATASITQAMGSADAKMNIDVTGLWGATINVNTDMYITGSFWEDGSSTVNVNGAYTLSVDTMHVERFNLIGVDNDNRATYIGRFDMPDISTYTAENANLFFNGDVNINTSNNSNTNRAIILNDNVNYTHTGGGIRLGENNENATAGTAKFVVAGNNSVLNIANQIEFRGENRKGGDTSFEVSGNNNIINTNNIRMGGSKAEGGTAIIDVSGEDNMISLTGNIEWTDAGKSGGDAIIRMSGARNTITSAGGRTNIDGWSGGSVDNPNIFSGGNSGIEITGVGNRFESSGPIAIGLGDGTGLFYGGKGYLSVMSESATVGEEAVIKTNEIHLGLATKNGDVESTYVSELTFGGNTRLEKYNVGADLNIYVGRRGWGTAEVTINSGTAVMNVINSNNVLNMTSLYVGSGGQSNGQRDGGDSYVNISGSLNELNISGQLNIVSQNGGSTGGKGVFTLDGTNNSVIVDSTALGNADGAFKARGEFIIKGKGNTFQTREFKFGSGSGPDGAVDPTITSIFRVVGGGNTVKITGGISSWMLDPGSKTFDSCYANGTFADGTWWVFEFDADGITTVEVDGHAGIDQNFVLLDFTNADIENMNNVVLISADSIAKMGNDRIKAILSDGTLVSSGEMGANGEYFELVDNGNTLTFNYYAPIPEPSTIAAIFGALALALAAYRRRK